MTIRVRRHRLTAFGIVASLAILSTPPPAAGQTWTGAALDGGNWNTANNWTNPAAVPNSITADVIFGDTGTGSVSLLSSVSTRSLTFTNGAGSYNITSSSATLSNVTAITVSPAVTATQTINLANVASGSLLFAGNGGPFTITNNAAAAAGTTLVIGPNTALGTVFFSAITVAGTGTTEISGSFVSGSHAVFNGLTKAGPGRLIFSGNGSNLSGGLTLAGGTLELNYTTNSSSKLGGGNLTSTGGDLVLASSGTITQNFSGTAFSAGHTEVTATTSSFITLGLAGISRGLGATLNLSGDTGFITVTTPTGSTNGLLGNGPAFATVSGTNWAGSTGTHIYALGPNSTNVFSMGTNTDVSGDVSPATFTTNSLRFNTSSTLHLSTAGTNTLQSGGILMTSTNFNNVTITGGALASGSNELIVHQYSQAALIIDATINASAGLTKTGPGTLILTGGDFFTGLTGPININRGSLQITTSNYAASNGSAINFNDDRGGLGEQQTFTVQFGDNVNPPVSRPIRFAASSAAGTYANVISTGISQNSRVTLSGIVSSAPGTVTPIAFAGTSTQTSGFNLTAVNTFTGDVYLAFGTVGIKSNASLGNVANTLVLGVGSRTAGGLEFLNGGIDLARPITVDFQTRVLSNGFDINTISGPVSGAAPLVKDGIGTLVLSGVNSQPGLSILAGTLRAASDANLSMNSSLIDINYGATLAITGTFATNHFIYLGPPFSIMAGTSTIDVATGQTLTLNSQVSGFHATLLKTGPGGLVLGAANTFDSGTIVQQGALQVVADTGLGAAGTSVTVSTAGSLTYAGSTSTSRTFNLNGSTLSVTPAATLTFNNASVFGGFWTGSFTTQAGSANTFVAGTTATSATVIQGMSSDSFTNFSNGGQLTTPAGATAALTRFTNTSSGRITVTGTANVSDFVSDGQVNVNPGGVINNTGSSLVFGGGSVTNLGVYNPVNGQVTPGGTISLGDTDMVIQGGLVRNNGTITSNNGNIIVDFGGVLRGAGVNDVNSVMLRNGGQLFSGNSPGPSFNRNVDLTNQGVTGVDISRATGTAGADWGVFEYGATNTTNGRLTITGTPADKAIFKMETVTDVAPRTASAPLTDFDPLHPYTWEVFRPGTQNSVAEISIVDALTNLTVSGSQLNDAVLNEYLGFDASGWDWGTTPVAERGFFAFTFEPDTLGNANRVIALVYSPVPEPGTLALVGAAAAGIAFGRAVCRSRISNLLSANA